MFKFREYLPAMIMTNMSTLLLISVDGIVVGNFLGKDALSAVSVFTPLLLFVGALTEIGAIGIGTCLSTSIGSNEGAQIKQIKGASFWLMVYLSVFASIFQIPVIWVLLKAYGLPDNIYAMVWQYAIGLMIATPLGVISTVGANMLQIVGRMKMLTMLTLLEGSVNLVLDLLFVGPLQMGVVGAGLGTTCANMVRCSTTLICLLKFTDMLGYRERGHSFSEYAGILRLGVPNAVSSLVNAVQYYILIRILLLAFGDSAGTIDGVCAFSYSVVAVLVNGIIGSMRPMVGLLEGAGDVEGLKILMQQGIRFMTVMIGAATALVMFFPTIFYSIYGVDIVPPGGLSAVRVHAVYFLPQALVLFLLLFLVNKKDTSYTAKVILAGNITQPVFAFIFMHVFSAPWIYLAKTTTAVLVLILFFRRFRQLYKMDIAEAEKLNNAVLYMSVRQEDAVEASRAIRRFAKENGFDHKISYRVGLCLEEMVAYMKSVNGRNILAQIIVRYRSDGGATFVIMDNGKCIALQKEEDREKGLTTDNYVLMQRLAKSVKYQYVQDMNYTIMEFA